MPQAQSWFPVQKQPTLAVTFTPLPQPFHALLPLPPSPLATKTDAMFQHQLLPTQLQPFLLNHTPPLPLLTVTTTAVTPRPSLLNVPKKPQQPPSLQNHTPLLLLPTVTTMVVTSRPSLPRLLNKHHWPLPLPELSAQSPNLLLQLLILLLLASPQVSSSNPKVLLLV
ncbi:hypothetical protein H769_YJM689A00086 [Saccharomyces cerevisiae YJM689]|nr:hypothetical protein H769_YJM689A00086 [Saccharomyces cerevisiae YJM689]